LWRRQSASAEHLWFYRGDATLRINVDLKDDITHNARSFSDGWVHGIDALFQMGYCLWTGYCEQHLRCHLSNAYDTQQEEEGEPSAQLQVELVRA
jgi:hypothetical protein